MWPGEPNPDIELLLFKPPNVAHPNAARAAGQRCDVAALFAAASSAAVVQNRLTTLLGAFSVAGATEHRGQALLDAIESYVGSNAERQQEFEVAAGNDLLEACFCSIDDVATLDLSHFEATVDRLVSLQGKRIEDAGAIAGMEAGEFWSLLLSACAPTFDDVGNELQIGERRPELWVRLVRRSIDAGMTADSQVYREGTWPKFDRRAGTESFREAVAARAGAAAAAIYDAVWAEHAMIAHLGPPSPNCATTPARRTRCV